MWGKGQIQKQLQIETLPKAQRTRGLSSAYQSNFFRLYHKFLHKFWSNIFRISTKHQPQNLNQTSAFRQNLKLKILTKPSFRISTKIELHNLNQASAAKYWPNFSFKSAPKLQLQNLDQTLCSKSEQKISQICNKLLPTRSSASTSAKVTT